jgi:hypothetical protein
MQKFSKWRAPPFSAADFPGRFASDIPLFPTVCEKMNAQHSDKERKLP